MRNKIETHETRVLIETRTSLNLVQLEEDLFLYRRSFTSHVQSADSKSRKINKSDLPDRRQAGFVNAAGARQLRNDITPSNKNTKDLVWVDSDLLPVFRMDGYVQGCEKLQERYEGLPDAWDAWEENPDRPLDTLVRLDEYSHQVFDRHDRPLAQSILFDYISGRVNNEDYDLKKAYMVLSKRKDIRLFRGDERLSEGYSKDPQPKNYEEAVFTIPYYNRTQTCSEALQFLWIPTQSQFEALFKKDRGVSNESVIDSDVLGLAICKKENKSKNTKEIRR